jgi:hypothetical protein
MRTLRHAFANCSNKKGLPMKGGPVSFQGLLFAQGLFFRVRATALG